MMFKVGDRVRYKTKRFVGKVISRINENDKIDRRLQGPRYEVLFRSGHWSIPEESLVSVEIDAILRKELREG